MRSIDWGQIGLKLLHGALLVASAYVAQNPKHAWLIPVLQAVGSAANSPLATQQGRPLQLTNPVVEAVSADAPAKSTAFTKS